MIIQAGIRSENTCIPVDIRKHCLLQKQSRTAITIGGWDSNRRWKNLGGFCSRSRYIIIPSVKKIASQENTESFSHAFLEAKALAFSSDYNAMEAINFLFDEGIMVPDQISVTGYDDSVYASMIRPKLTTVHQDIPQKAHVAFGTSDEIDSGRDAERI